MTRALEGELADLPGEASVEEAAAAKREVREAMARAEEVERRELNSGSEWTGPQWKATEAAAPAIAAIAAAEGGKDGGRACREPSAGECAGARSEGN